VTGDTRPTAPAVRPFHLSLPVRDLDEAADWYVEVLGTGRRRTGPGWVDLDLFGSQLSLHLVEDYEPDPRTTTVDGTAVPLRHHGVVLDPDTWHALVDRLEAAGVPFLLSTRSRFVGEPGEQHTFFLTDPSGNAIEVKAFPDGIWT
jgi:uncharacterized protein